VDPIRDLGAGVIEAEEQDFVAKLARCSATIWMGIRIASSSDAPEREAGCLM
jgi:hypothetical protein